jgi:hypothetical protein
MAKKSAQKTHNFRFDYEFPIRDVSTSRTPVLIGHGDRDRIVPLRHAQELFKYYGIPDKQLYIFEGEHFRARPYHWYAMAARFVYRRLGLSATPRFYEHVYGQSLLHVGCPSSVFADLKHVQAIQDDEPCDVSL